MPSEIDLPTDPPTQEDVPPANTTTTIVFASAAPSVPICEPKDLAAQIAAMDQVFECIKREFDSLSSNPWGAKISGVLHMQATWVELQKVGKIR